jgi:peptidoglycan hydrolase FlgJ
MAVDSTNVTRSYLDFQGLGELRGRAAQDGKGALRETSQQFEALFIQMMMKSMREATFKSDMLQSDALDTYQDMFDREISVAMASRSSMGLADMLNQQLSGDTQTSAMPSGMDIKSKPMALNPPAQPMALGAPNGKVLPLNRPQTGQPMPMPSHWVKQGSVGTADDNMVGVPESAASPALPAGAAMRPLNDAGDGYADEAPQRIHPTGAAS